ncbi:THUMP-like domain-containing protein [Flavobacterium sp.]|uniref:class I SAM-dependent methyltransferase n=1 Tax=Flavobacterium sp. TaxID=239 RepID=UPI0039E6365B
MLLEALLTNEIQEYIRKQCENPTSQLAFQKNPFPHVEWKLILQQIEAKAKAKEKLPLWYSTRNIIYPSKISVEQTSSEKTAIFKSSLIRGKKIIDLTGGFGIDAYFFSKQFESVIHSEQNAVLSSIVQHNFKQLNANNIQCIAGNSEEILSSLQQQFDWLYIDPSRRNEQKGKVFMLKDCEPNVPELMNYYFQFSKQILIKTAPILDIKAGLNELNFVKNIHIIAVENEVKELLWEIEKEYSGQPTLKTVNLTKSKTELFDFVLNEDSSKATLGKPEKYLYEPNAAIMKSGGFDEVAHFFKLKKLHPHSHLYTSNELINFCGRVFELQQTILYNKKNMMQLGLSKANITTRNFPETVETLRKKWKIKDGGEVYCFFTTDDENQKIVLLCKKL